MTLEEHIYACLCARGGNRAELASYAALAREAARVWRGQGAPLADRLADIPTGCVKVALFGTRLADLVCFKCRGRMREVVRTNAASLKSYNIRCVTEGCHFERAADSFEAQLAVQSTPRG